MGLSRMIKKLISLLKVNHWLKNIIVFIPLIFSLSFSDDLLLFKTILVFLSFCLISSATYILNDILDINSDKLHPVKCNRIIASGKISIFAASFIMLFLIIFSLFLSFYIHLGCFIVILSYFILNVLYSLYLKKLMLIDVLCIALGFILRILIACIAIGVIPSPFVILMTFFCSLFFTFIKRKLELKLLGAEHCRSSVKKLDLNSLNQFILLSATLSISFYFTYMLDKTTILRAGTEFLYITSIPFTLIIFRILYLVDNCQVYDDPIIYFEKDLILKVFIVMYIFVLFVLILI